MTVYDLAYAAAKLQATNEQDYVNGMLGVTGLAINPDCTHDKPQYGPWTERTLNFCELKFLFMAGIGFFDYPAGCPTWFPTFPA
ncbi:hypothetical protein QC762_512335 [Podospora pseudocomata]|uniref:Uncharacterized protein n=1 Tax=Podospora pseudocomata TaxID=2093779 RepID=A0ABR0GCI8_9PEZI|nr:hypothetical protein QC762_512335 [Podospora pseudocomata]